MPGNSARKSRAVKDDNRHRPVRHVRPAVTEADQQLHLVKHPRQTDNTQLAGGNIAKDSQHFMDSLEANNVPNDAFTAAVKAAFDKIKAENDQMRAAYDAIKAENDMMKAANDKSSTKAGLSHTGPYYAAGDQYNTGGGTQNITNGAGNQFPGATFSGPTHIPESNPT